MLLRIFLVFNLLLVTGVTHADDELSREDLAKLLKPKMPAPVHGVKIKKFVMISMRDGIRLATDIYFPVNSRDRYPVVLTRHPYDRDDPDIVADALMFASRGFVFVNQNERGFYHSEGRAGPIPRAREDGYDTISWLAEQPWSNGKIGTYGCSSAGENQPQLAAVAHPNHAAMITAGDSGALGTIGRLTSNYNTVPPVVMANFPYYATHMLTVWPQFPNGTGSDAIARAAGYFNFNPVAPEIDWNNAIRHLPLIDILRVTGTPSTLLEQQLKLSPFDPYWRKQGYYMEQDTWAVPAIHINSWRDYGYRETIKMYQHARHKGAVTQASADNQYLIIAPTEHCSFAGAEETVDVGLMRVRHADPGFYKLYLRWFRRWLMDDQSALNDLPRVQTYVVGKDKWRAGSEWPYPGTRRQIYYLTSGGDANTRAGDGRLTTTIQAAAAYDEFRYDPHDPMPSCQCDDPELEFLGAFDMGYEDQAMAINRQDALIYKTEVFTKGREFTGDMSVVLYVGSSARDTDFVLRILDIPPDGPVIDAVTNIIQRVRYREGYDKELMMEKDQVYRLEFADLHLSHYFRPGHRLGLFISSSHFPYYERNLNTGGNNYDEDKGIIALNRVYHTGQYKSYLSLPVVPKNN